MAHQQDLRFAYREQRQDGAELPGRAARQRRERRRFEVGRQGGAGRVDGSRQGREHQLGRRVAQALGQVGAGALGQRSRRFGGGLAQRVLHHHQHLLDADRRQQRRARPAGQGLEPVGGQQRGGAGLDADAALGHVLRGSQQRRQPLKASPWRELCA